MRHVAKRLLAAGLALSAAIGSGAHAQVASIAPRMITRAIDEASRVALAGNTRPEAAAAVDRGLVPDDTPIEHVLLQLKRSPLSEQAFVDEIQALHDPASPEFHHWLTASQIGDRYGLAADDLAAITGWLAGYRFNVNVVYGNGVLIDFSGTAAQIRRAFHTEIHALDVGGQRHIANLTDPEIPAALAPAIAGIVSLHDFRPRRMIKPRPAYTVTCNTGACDQAVTPGDLAVIYDLKAAFAAGYTGQGQTVAVIEDTNVYAPADWTVFRETFGLSAYSRGAFIQRHPAPPSGATNCANPGVVSGDEAEAALDAEWASAAAPDAQIELASCAGTSTTFGGLIAIQNMIAQPTHPQIISISYGECEAQNGAAANAAYATAYQQAAAEGISVFVSSGDEGAASCDANRSIATHGVSVSGLASTVYNVAVGGTDFADTDNGDNRSYWSSKNGAYDVSALSYIPEIPWNDSCASRLIAKFAGFASTYGASGFCNSANGEASYLTTSSGSGGPSGCATGAPSIDSVVSGTCRGFAKPSWQKLIGNPSDGARDIPDVSLFAANGAWGHYYVYCDSDLGDGGAKCVGAPANWSGAGGTSFAAPILAGIQALVNQRMRGPQGNPNPVYYQLARAEYGAQGNVACESDIGGAPAPGCVFHNIVRGDINVNCTGAYDCYIPSGTNGVLLTKVAATATIAYASAVGWNFATGIGSVNAYNLITQWSNAFSTTAAQAR
jgi:subtilase family serine protease